MNTKAVLLHLNCAGRPAIKKGIGTNNFVQAVRKAGFRSSMFWSRKSTKRNTNGDRRPFLLTDWSLPSKPILGKKPSPHCWAFYIFRRGKRTRVWLGSSLRILKVLLAYIKCPLKMQEEYFVITIPIMKKAESTTTIIHLSSGYIPEPRCSGGEWGKNNAFVTQLQKKSINPSEWLWFSFLNRVSRSRDAKEMGLYY